MQHQVCLCVCVCVCMYVCMCVCVCVCVCVCLCVCGGGEIFVSYYDSEVKMERYKWCMRCDHVH